MVNQRISLKDVQIAINGKVIGGAEELTATIAADNEVAFEGGNYFGVEVVDGKKNISGTITRAWVDNELLNELAPSDTAGLWPSFTIVADVVSGKEPGRTMTIFGAKMDSVDINSLTLDGFAKNSIPFKALNWRFD